MIIPKKIPQLNITCSHNVNSMITSKPLSRLFQHRSAYSLDTLLLPRHPTNMHLLIALLFFIYFNAGTSSCNNRQQRKQQLQINKRFRKNPFKETPIPLHTSDINAPNGIFDPQGFGDGFSSTSFTYAEKTRAWNNIFLVNRKQIKRNDGNKKEIIHWLI